MLTIFGYAAPATDVEAVDLLLRGWGDNPTFELAQVNIVDIKPEEELRKTRSEEHTSELQSRLHLVCRLLLEKKKNTESWTYPSLLSPSPPARHALLYYCARSIPP